MFTIHCMLAVAVPVVGGHEFSPISADILLAKNARGEFAAALDPGGLTVVAADPDSAGSKQDWHVTLSEVAIGRAPELRYLPKKSTLLLNEGARVERSRGAVKESFANEESGLRMQWLVNSKPASEPEDELLLAWRLATTLGAKPTDDGRAVYFHDGSDDRILRLSLAVRDAVGASLPARFHVSPGSLQVRIKDRGYSGSLTVELVLGSPHWTVDGDQNQAGLGSAVFAAGDVNGDGFSDLAVGAPLYDGVAGSDCGRVLVYHGTASGITGPAAWTEEGDQAGAQFGASLSTGGSVNGDKWDDLIVGAPFYDAGESDEGRAYLYLGTATGLRTDHSWTIETNQADARLGSSVSLAGDVNGDGLWDVVLGAPRYSNGESEEGRVLVHHGISSGLAVSASWTAESNQAGAELGTSVSTAGDVNADGFDDLIAGAPLHDGVDVDQGRAFVWHGSSSGLSSAPDWEDSHGGADARFGSSVSLAGDTNADGFGDAVVGAPNAAMQSGLAYVYAGSSGGLATSPLVLSLSPTESGAHFGAAVSTAGDANGDGIADIAMGAPDYGAGDEGWVGLYLGSHSGLATAPIWTTTGGQAGARLGTGLATAGDVNGDGRCDLLVGAPGFDAGESDEGRATLFLGKSGLLGSALPSPSGSYAGDVNGDGYSDVILGEPSFDGVEQNQGRVLVYAGSSSGLEVTPLAQVTRPLANLMMGRSVSTAGDVNGDGYDDIVYGAVQHALMSLGSPGGPPDLWDWQQFDADDSFGQKVGSAGDQNGDGFGDFFVTDFADFGNGEVHIFRGSKAGPPNPASFIIQISTEVWVTDASSAGDFNRDGYTDFVVGYIWLPLYYHGRFRFYKGGPGALSLFWTFNNGDSCDDYLGESVTWAGDVNRDGKSETAISENTDSNCGSPPHLPDRVHVYFNIPGSRWTVSSGEFKFIETRGTLTGDVNADGYSDLLVGPVDSRLYLGSAAGPVDSGLALGGTFLPGGGDVNGDGYADVVTSPGSVRFGGGSRGVSYAPRQMRSDLSAPVALLGSSRMNSITLAANGRSSAGRRSVRLEWQMALLHQALESQPIDAGSAADSGAPTAEGSVVPLLGPVEHLKPGGNYHWRARIAADHPLFPRSIWFTLPNSNSSEQKFRVPPAHADDPVGEGPLHIR